MERREHEMWGRMEKEKMRQYLLGEMSEEEMTALEERYFSDDHYFDELSMVEDELIDDSICGLLSVEDRALFEKAYLTSPRRREKVEIAAGMMKALGGADDRTSSSLVKFLPALFQMKKPFAAIAMVAAGLILVLGCAGLIVVNIHLYSRLGRVLSEQASLREEAQRSQSQFLEQQKQTSQSTTELQRERYRRSLLEEEISRMQQSRGPIMSFVLFPGATRDMEESNNLKIPKQVERVSLRLMLEKEGRFKSYRAVVRTIDGKQLWAQDQLRLSPGNDPRSDIAVTLPASVLLPGDYVLTLSGITTKGAVEDVEDYFLRVVNK